MAHAEVRGLDEQGNDVVLGRISFDGRKVTAEPSEIQGLIETPLRDYQAGGLVSAQDDPERFMQVLHTNYRSPYLRVGRPGEVGGKELSADEIATAAREFVETVAQAVEEEMGQEPQSGEMASEQKAMSASNETAGGALVPPPAQADPAEEEKAMKGERGEEIPRAGDVYQHAQHGHLVTVVGLEPAGSLTYLRHGARAGRDENQAGVAWFMRNYERAPTAVGRRGRRRGR